jgi:REP element-mobilizing transposase RayT
MSTHLKIIYHIVFSTKNREPTLVANKRDDLYRYIWGALKNKKCHLFRIGGIEDHLHILTSLHPTIALASLVKDIKLSCSKMIKEEGLFLGFSGWQNG